MVLESAAFHLFFSSGPAKILHSVSTDGQTWATPNPVAVRGKQPAVVRFAGLWLMIVACEAGLCAATAKGIAGPWTAANPIWRAQPGQFEHPIGLALARGTLFVSEFTGRRLQGLAALTGEPLFVFSAPSRTRCRTSTGWR